MLVIFMWSFPHVCADRDRTDPLAYLTAKSHGYDDDCQEILDASGLSADQITLPTMDKPARSLTPITPTYKSNWPVKSAASQSKIEKALLGHVESLSLEDDTAAVPNDAGFEDGLDEMAGTREGKTDGEDEDAAGWDMGDDVQMEVENEFFNVDNADGGAGSSEADQWARNSPIPADHVAAGSFETAMLLLNRQVAVVNFEPLKPRFLEIYQASRTYLPASVGLPPLVNYVRRTVDETDPRKVLPIIPRDLDSIASGDLQAGYTAMKTNSLEEGVKMFKRVLQNLLVNAVGSAQEANEVMIYSQRVFESIRC